jgi:RimJ/RimL family protein N-acetyltransferase
MSNVYETCPVFETDKWLLRLIEKEDAADLIDVYSDKNALPFFNSDNCDGDNFYYPTMEKMNSAIDFWIYSYNEKFFVRWTIIDKTINKAVGTIEMFHRDPNGDFGHVGLLRLDVGSAYENSRQLKEILDIIIPPAFEMFDCAEIVSKVPIYAVERAEAFSAYGFRKSDICLIGGSDKYAYNGYWTYRK